MGIIKISARAVHAQTSTVSITIDVSVTRLVIYLAAKTVMVKSMMTMRGVRSPGAREANANLVQW